MDIFNKVEDNLNKRKINGSEVYFGISTEAGVGGRVITDNRRMPENTAKTWLAGQLVAINKDGYLVEPVAGTLPFGILQGSYNPSGKVNKISKSSGAQGWAVSTKGNYIKVPVATANKVLTNTMGLYASWNVDGYEILASTTNLSLVGGVVASEIFEENGVKCILINRT